MPIAKTKVLITCTVTAADLRLCFRICKKPVLSKGGSILTEEQSNHQSLHCLPFYLHHLSRVVRKPAFCICENKDADQLRSNRKADQRLCFSLYS